jgi:hypothetical protein
VHIFKGAFSLSWTLKPKTSDIFDLIGLSWIIKEEEIKCASNAPNRLGY